MNGLHLTADLRDCAPSTAALTNVDALRALCLDAVREAGLTPVGELFHRFPGAGGGTGVVLLAESHVAVHTWPEMNAVTLDVYVCNFGADNTARAHTLMNHLQAHLHPGRVERHTLHRGTAP
ncbi:adenosylmethionine decarboxylase [Rhizobacter sp. Root1221]|jgi:S-adenosylmethionine decarboxylase|uniref:adenosylmethionine decarboxylase n=1 Tax=Rhizobacter sp. Root1221 TaxID=1736433 RepID=UPI0006FB51DF|nr:adenosylmethionine decarboxylase [Rhizobacter sp. Root1221]KQV91578.1 S-adenosylmethionine decarboxylase proenzyme [Rhizobacter sp. Root1221]